VTFARLKDLCVADTFLDSRPFALGAAIPVASRRSPRRSHPQRGKSQVHPGPYCSGSRSPVKARGRWRGGPTALATAYAVTRQQDGNFSTQLSDHSIRVSPVGLWAVCIQHWTSPVGHPRRYAGSAVGWGWHV